MYVVVLTIQYCSTFLWYLLGYVHKDPDIFETTYFFTRYGLPLACEQQTHFRSSGNASAVRRLAFRPLELNPLNPKIKI